MPWCNLFVIGNTICYQNSLSFAVTIKPLSTLISYVNWMKDMFCGLNSFKTTLSFSNIILGQKMRLSMPLAIRSQFTNSFSQMSHSKTTLSNKKKLTPIRSHSGLIVAEKYS